MSLLSRKEQETLINSFERDYGKLIMQSKNRIINQKNFSQKISELRSQIDEVISNQYLEEDNIEFLSSMSNSIRIVEKNEQEK